VSLLLSVTQRAVELAAGFAVLGIGIGILRQSLLLAGCFAVMAIGMITVRAAPPVRGVHA
jgi:hypothetical protein